MFGKKNRTFTIQYDSEKEYPVIRASICNGEKVAGFKNREDGHFTEVMFISSDADLREFMRSCGIDEIKTEY